MKRGAMFLTVLALVFAAGAGGVKFQGSAEASAQATTITVWLPFGGRELGVMKRTIAEYDNKNSNVKIKVAGDISTTKIVAAIRAGNAPDLAMDFESANIGTYCSSGAWSDLGPYLKKDKVDVNIFPSAARYYTQYKGKRCAMPLLADVAGLYYNKKMFKAAGLTRPPRTISELTAYAKKLIKFHAGEGDEYSSSNGFESGKLAMNLDGEWRVAFIAAEKPGLAYGTAPLPVDDAKPGLYGSSALNGSIAGIPKNAKHKDQAWALLKYLTTQDHPLAQLSNGLRNVPTTKSSLASPEIKPDKHFSVFLKIYAHPKSSTVPITAAGVQYQDLFTSFVTKWQAGHAKDLAGGLKKVDKQIDAQLKQAGGGVP